MGKHPHVFRKRYYIEKRFIMMDEKWTANEIGDQAGKTAIITGANSGIGYEAALELSRKGARVVFACRNAEKAREAMEQIQEEIPAADLEFIRLDLASLDSIRQFADRFKAGNDRLDILLNNAGIMMVPYGKTSDGFEQTLGINHLGHFALTGLLLEDLITTPGARVVNVSSNAHYGGEMDFDNLLFSDGKGYSRMGAYGRSKLANLLFTYELQRRFEANGHDAAALSAHPGISATALVDHLFRYRMVWMVRLVMKLLFQSSEMGALPSLRAAVDPAAKGGEYYGPNGKGEKTGYPVLVGSSPAASDAESARELWRISEELTGVHFLD
jgi:NAD(P)-dependent dehydrogenase (short-subunit alcohol dehydrogenase family)